MRLRRITALSLLCAVALAFWLGLASGAPRAARVARSGGASVIPRLSLSQIAGQHVIYAYSGLRPPSSLLSVIRAGEAGGVILFGPNISSRAQIGKVIAQLQTAALASSVHERLLVLVDQEGGQVRRLPGAPALSEKQIGASGDSTALARAAGAGAGQNLRSVGANVNLAPVLDVYRHSGNFIDEFARSYSSRPGTVATLASAFIAAQQQTRVSATAKHFPGLGAASTSQNTDLRPVRLSQSLATLRSTDEVPYRAAIGAGVHLVMLSWAIYPALDSRWPAGLSSLVIQRELRDQLGFRGVTITDGIDAGAVTPFGSLARRSVRAAEAGADLILCAAPNPAENTPQQGIAVQRALAAALADRQLSLSASRQSVARILGLPR